jgi:hypothetical protein
MATMTDEIPEMDYPEHERTFRGFQTLTEMGIAHVLCMVLVVAIWGVKHSGGWALLGFVLTIAATVIGALSPALTWRPIAAILVLLLIVFALA